MKEQNTLISDEIEVLEMVAGLRPWEKGAWVNACFEYLQENRYVSPSLLSKPTMTEKGIEYLKRLNE